MMMNWRTCAMASRCNSSFLPAFPPVDPKDDVIIRSSLVHAEEKRRKEKRKKDEQTDRKKSDSKRERYFEVSARCLSSLSPEFANRLPLLSHSIS
mmetsp:Transcript_12922/g.25276  ORF Transcript_12922/g.25276 Transcript_12922/m.25276 type:complete len:95 (-) Transcript_12922:751-1035(-)